MRWWLVLAILTSMVVAAWAQPAVGTEQARQAMQNADQRVATLSSQRDQLNSQFQRQNDAIDRLKNERQSWRRDDKVAASKADAQDTADRLAALVKQLTAAQAALVAARGKLAQAIDAELAATPPPTTARASELQKWRAQLGGLRPAKKIVIPDAEIDPLADPEDLDAQAAALKGSEQELNRQVKELGDQAKDLAHQAELLKNHERTKDLARRDDEQPLRTQAVSHGEASSGTFGTVGFGAGSGAGSGSTPPANDTGGGDRGSPSTPATATTGFENEATIVLGDVVDQATIDGLNRALRSGDPAQRAEAAAHTRDQVRKRLEALQKKRAAIEARSRQLRGAK